VVGVSAESAEVESPYSWWRLVACVCLGALGGVGMWSVVVVLPTVQAEFHAARGGASLPYTLTMVGFAFGSVLMGRLADRFGIAVPMLCSSLCLGGWLHPVEPDRQPVAVRHRARRDGRHAGQLDDVRPADG